MFVWSSQGMISIMILSPISDMFCDEFFMSFHILSHSFIEIPLWNDTNFNRGIALFNTSK